MDKTRSRNWVFTLNNYTPDDIKIFSSIKDCKFTFQEEIGEQGTPHLQGLLVFKNAKTFAKMKKIHIKAHWEVCKNVRASQLYCSKNDTRSGEIFTNMDPPELRRQVCHQSKEERLREHIMKHKELDEEDQELLKQVPIEISYQIDPTRLRQLIHTPEEVDEEIYT